MLTGTYQHVVDIKGRLAIPVALREELGDSFRITVGFPNEDFGKNCLALYSNKSWAKIEAKHDAMSRDEKNKMRPFYTRSGTYELDGQGRVLLPQKVRDWAELKKNVAIVGVGDSVEIWDAEVWEKIDALETTQENIASIYRELNF